MQEIARVGNSAIPQIAGYHVWPSSRSGEGKPDIRGVSGNKQDLLLIECKLWAGLTEHQPVTYLNRLPQDGVLLFIVPEQRRLSLAMKLEQKLVNSQIATGNWVEAGTIKVLFGEPSTGGNPYP